MAEEKHCISIFGNTGGIVVSEEHSSASYTLKPAVGGYRNSNNTAHNLIVFAVAMRGAFIF